MRRLQLSLSPNLAGHFLDAAQIKARWQHVLPKQKNLNEKVAHPWKNQK